MGDGKTFTDKSYSAAREAVASMERHGITPTAEHYEVWQAFHGAGPAELKAELQRLIDSGRVVDDVMCDALYFAHFADLDMNERVMQAGGRFATELADVMSTLEKAGAKTIAYGKELEQARVDLATARAPAELGAVVSSLAGATSDMARHSGELERRLRESSDEVAALRDQLDRLRAEASTDALTGVANRKAFESKLEELGKAADAGGPRVSIVLCDIDFFKRVNDSFGHQTGDQVIRFVATVMARAAPEGAMIARLGGEEFAILMAGHDLRSVGALAERVRKSVETKRLVRRASNEDLGQITVSLGYALREAGEAGPDFVDRADAALYASKRGGRNRSTAADPVSAAA